MGWASHGAASQGASELRSCVNVEVDVLNSMSLTDSPYGFCERQLRTQELCERRGGRPELHVPN